MIYVYTIHTGIVRLLVLAFIDVSSQNCKKIVGRLYRNRRVSAEFKWKSYEAHVMSVRSPYDFFSEPLQSPYDHLMSPNYHTKSCGDGTIIAGSPYDATYDMSMGYALIFLKMCKSADYYKIVEATEIIESHRIVGSFCGDHKKMQKLSLYDHKLIVGQM